MTTTEPTAPKKRRTRSRGNRNAPGRVARREARMAAGREGFLAREAKREAQRQREELKTAEAVRTSTASNPPAQGNNNQIMGTAFEQTVQYTKPTAAEQVMQSTKPTTVEHKMQAMTPIAFEQKMQYLKPTLFGHKMQATMPTTIEQKMQSTLAWTKSVTLNGTGFKTSQPFDNINLPPSLPPTVEDSYDRAMLVNTKLRSPSTNNADTHQRRLKAIHSLLIYPRDTGDYWLSDETITVIMEAISTPSHIKVFSARWAGDYSRQSTAYAKVFDDFYCAQFFIPFQSGSGSSAHWSLIHIRRSEKVIDYYDSLSHTDIISSAKGLVRIIFEKHRSVFPGVYSHNNAICQIQPDGNSCGLFVVLNATCILQNNPIWVEGATPQWIRWKVASHLSRQLPREYQLFTSHTIDQYFRENHNQIQLTAKVEPKM